ncbi:MAG: hypothetical protein FJX62_18440 [Alphaproteobacteria bacterium]|nr:hypothetical protein [Alphaproteobacteria bacterium]
MGRTIALLVLAYGCGHPAAEAYRPAAADRPLRDFHRAVDTAIADSRRALAVLDDARRMRYLADGLRRLDGAI